jgi:hypothetical protein
MNNQPTSPDAAEAFQRRSLDILPQIDISGTAFTVDWRLKELRETAAPWNTISLRNMDMDHAGENYLCFYDTEAHSLWRFDLQLTALPDHVVLLEIPNEIKLDPYAVANEYGIEPAEFISNFAIEKDLTAVVKHEIWRNLKPILAVTRRIQTVGEAGSTYF